MRKDTRGVAAMFDALMFLAVASVVSVALLGAFTEAPTPSGESIQAKVEAAHLVLLRSTLPSGSGNNITVMEMAAAEVHYLASERSTTFASDALPLLLPGMSFEWEVECSGSSLVTPPGETSGGSIYCSTADVDMPWGRVVYKLRAWMA